MTKTITVIGGGLGGLSAAISLAADGHQVRLFEKNQHLGGKLNQTIIEGFSFDLGPSILTMPHIFRRLFELHGQEMDQFLEIERLDLEWRSIFEDGTIIDLYSDLDEMLEQNQELTSNDINDIEEYLDYAGGISELVEEGYFAEGLDTLGEVLKFYGPIKAFFGLDYFSTMAAGVEKRINNPYLQHIYNFFIKYVGS
ncbi:MAG: phytoene desaturase family protein, partial [Bacillota bacterium]